MAENKKTKNASAKKKTDSAKKTDSRKGKKETESIGQSASGKVKKTYGEKQQIYAICFIAAGVLMCCFALIPGIKLWAYIRGVLFAFWGSGFFLLTFLLFAFGIIAATNKFRKSPSTFVYTSFFETVLFSAFIHICTHSVGAGGFSSWWENVKESCLSGWNVSIDGMCLTGGISGAAFGGLFLQAFGKTAAIATIIILFIVNTMLLTGLTFNILGKSIRDVFSKLHEKRKVRKAEKKVEKEEMERRVEQERIQDEEKKRREQEIIDKAIAQREARIKAELSEKQKKIGLESDDLVFPVEKPENIRPHDAVFTDTERKEPPVQDNPIRFSGNPDFKFTNPFIKPKRESEPEKPNPYTHPKHGSENDETAAEDVENDTSAEDINTTDIFSSSDDDETDRIVKQANDEANEAQRKTKKTVESFKDDSTVKKAEYRFPPISCLNEPKFGSESDFTSEMKSISQKLLDTLKSFGVETTLVGVSRGPSVTRYELQPAPGVKISKITNLADDIALSLASSGVRIEAPIPNKSAVGIEVPNRIKSMVTLREIISTKEFTGAKSKLNVALGKDITGNVRCADLAKMPHLLIAGTTGSGKSVLLNCMIASILFNATPDEVKLLMIDPKQVEFSVYNGIPHLLVPVISNVRQAAGSLSWAVTEMENRYKAFSECSVRDIGGFNKYVESHPELIKMPQIVIFIDELNDLMMVSPKEVEDSICRLAQKARAAGMHLVVATQRPSVDVITGIIKANIPSRISLSVSSQVDSRTILDFAGAEKLLGNGDMLYNPVGQSKAERIQGAFLSDAEIEKIVDFLRSQAEAEYDDEIMEEIKRQATIEKKKGSSSENNENFNRDGLYEKAIDCILDYGTASTTFLQKKLSLGYARASRIIDQLEEDGIIGPPDGSKARKILVTKEQVMEMKAYAETVNEE